MNDKLLDVNRLVYIERTLRVPDGLVTYETVPYWFALFLVLKFPEENNTKSVRIKEIEDYQLPEGEKPFTSMSKLNIEKWSKNASIIL